jgi:hypothetical protein
LACQNNEIPRLGNWPSTLTIDVSRPWLGAVTHGTPSAIEFGDLNTVLTTGQAAVPTAAVVSGDSPSFGASVVNSAPFRVIDGSVPATTDVLVVLEDYQALVGSPSTISIGNTPSVASLAPSSVEGLESPVLVDGSSKTGDESLAILTSGVELMRVSKIGGCFAGLIGMVALLA